MEFQNIDQIDPRTCISGKMNRINRLTANIFRKYLNPFGITDSQLTVLFILSKNPGFTQKEISEMIALEKSTLNRNLKRLFEKELLSRHDFPIIRITEKGKALVNSIVPEWQKAMNEIQLKLENDGEEALNLVLHKMTN